MHEGLCRVNFILDFFLEMPTCFPRTKTGEPSSSQCAGRVGPNGYSRWIPLLLVGLHPLVANHPAPGRMNGVWGYDGQYRYRMRKLNTHEGRV